MPNSMYTRFKKYNWVILSLLLSYSCSNNPAGSPVINSIHQLNITPLAKNQVYLVIPNAGCDGCITYAEEFFRNNIKKYPKLIYVLTKISSKKILKLKFGALLENKNVILDTTNRFGYPNVENIIYPAIVYTNDDKIVKIEYQSPGVDGINNLRKYYLNEK